MAFNPISGKTGSVLVGTVSYAFKKWTFNMKTNTPNVTNFNGGGYRQIVSGITQGQLQIEGPYDEGNMPLTAGNSYSFTLNWNSMVMLTCTAIISDMTPELDTDDAGRLKITAEVNGSFTAAVV